MNNLEKLLEQYENGKMQPLFDMVCIVPFCGDCIVEPICKGEGNCEEARARWLLQEYVEPDSWDKIDEDAKKLPTEYWNCYDAKCEECPAVFDKFVKPYEYYGVGNCNKAQRCDIVRRCKALAWVE